MSSGTLREYSVFDRNGELISSTITKRAPLLKGRWYVVHCKEFQEWLLSCKSFLQVKIVLTLAAKVTVESPYIKISNKSLAKQLHSSESTISKALKVLINEHIIDRTEVDGITAYIINPGLISKGGFPYQSAKYEWDRLHEPPIEQIVDSDTGEILNLPQL